MNNLAEEILKRKQENEEKGLYASFISKSATNTENSDIFSKRDYGLQHDIFSSGLCLWSIWEEKFLV